MSRKSIFMGQLRDGLGTRVIVVQKQLPDNLKALVIKPDSLHRTVDRDEVLAMAYDPDNNARFASFAEVLHARRLLQYFHDNKFIQAIDIDNIDMTPTPSQKVALREVINALNQQAGLTPLPTPEELQRLTPADPQSSDRKEQALGTQDRINIANSLLLQAKMMQDEVDKKLRQAYDINPACQAQGYAIKHGQPLAEPLVIDTTPPAVDTPAVKPARKTRSQVVQAVKSSKKARSASA